MLGKPNSLRLLSKSDFMFIGSTTNLRLKWLLICTNFDYESGKVELFLNGKKVNQTEKKPITLSKDENKKSMVLRIGKYYLDGTPMIGKVVNVNIWDR